MVLAGDRLFVGGPRDVVDEVLLVDWLNALTYEMATRRMLFARFAVTIVDHTLVASAWASVLSERDSSLTSSGPSSVERTTSPPGEE